MFFRIGSLFIICFMLITISGVLEAIAQTKVCLVTDLGGIDDKSFSASAWKGVTDAQARFEVEGKFLESQQQTDYEQNIDAFIEEGCDLIVNVGFLLGDATAAAAQANPDQNFVIVDFAYDPMIDNVLGLVFATDQAAFLAGYVAAGVTKTGVVGTFGGLQIPPVTVFMDGFTFGVQYYNKQHGTNVLVKGWDAVIQTGFFAGNFDNVDDGRRLGEMLIEEGADIILPVAGIVGQGAAAVAKEHNNVYIIGVDTDWTVSVPEYASITLTSVMKNMDVAVFNAINQVVDGTFFGGTFVGTLENNGVGIAPFHNLASIVPATLQDEVDKVRERIISGTIQIAPPEEDFSNVFFGSLAEGLNMISLPLKPPKPFTARSLAEEINATVVIQLDEKSRRFVGFTPDAPDDGFPIEGGKGYIVNMPEARQVAFVGAAWTNQPSVEAAPSQSIFGRSAWALVVNGKLPSLTTNRLNTDGYLVTVRNTRTNAIATDVVRQGYFAAAFADMSRNNVVSVGDRLEVTVIDTSGEIASEPIVITVTPSTISQAFVPITLTNVGKPNQNRLLQNYPNPFNPETWMPYQLTDESVVTIHIYDSQGHRVRTLDLGLSEAGFYRSRARAAYWDGRNSAGESVASGVYFYQILAGDFSATRRMLILK